MKAIESIKRSTQNFCVDCDYSIQPGEERYYARLDNWSREMYYCIECGGKR